MSPKKIKSKTLLMLRQWQQCNAGPVEHDKHGEVSACKIYGGRRLTLSAKVMIGKHGGEGGGEGQGRERTTTTGEDNSNSAFPPAIKQQ